MNKNLFLKFVSVVVLFTFLYPSLLYTEPLQYKMAAYSRMQKYLSQPGKNDSLFTPEQFPKALTVFTNAMAELNKAVNQQPSQDDINEIIGRLNGSFGENGIELSISNIEQIPGRPFRYVTLTFKDGQKRYAVFLDKNREDGVLSEYRVLTPEDKKFLEIPGLEDLWITSQIPEEIVVAAGGEVRSRDVGATERLGRLVADLISSLVHIKPADLAAKKREILKGLERVASQGKFGFRVLEERPDNRLRVIAVPFKRTRYTNPVTRETVYRYEYEKDRMRLVYYPSGLERLAVLAGIFGGGSADEIADGRTYVARFIHNLMTAERTRTQFGSTFLNSLNIHQGEEAQEKEAMDLISLISYIAMVNREGKISAGAAELKEDWDMVAAEYFWFTYVFSRIYNNPVELVESLKWDRGAVRNKVRREFSEILAKINRNQLGILAQQLGIQVSLENVDNQIMAIADRLTPKVLEIHNDFIMAVRAKAAASSGVVEEVEIAAGGEDGAGLTGGMKGVFLGDFIVLDYLMSNKMLEYARDKETGRIRKINSDPLDILVNMSRLSEELQKILRDNELQLVLTKPPSQLGWGDTIQRAASVIASNLEAVKRPNSIVRGEGLILKVDADGIIYVMPWSGADDTVIANIEKQVKDALRVQSAVSRLETAKQLKGFIDVESRILAIQDTAFQEILYRKLQELYNEGLSVVRVVGEPIELTGRMKAIIEKFNERNGTDEWRTITSEKANTVTLVSSDNTALADERQDKSTVIRLGFDGSVNMPQIFPALTIARAIIAVGGEENVTGGLFNDVKALYLSMVGEELRDEVNRATSIAQLLAIILPPITAEDLRIYEYLLLGRKIAEVAA